MIEKLQKIANRQHVARHFNLFWVVCPRCSFRMNEVFSFTIHVENISEILHRAEDSSDLRISCPTCNVEFSFEVAENSDLEPKHINNYPQEAVISLTMLGSKQK